VGGVKPFKPRKPGGGRKPATECSECRVALSRRGSRNGARCPACLAKAAKAYRKKNKEKIRAYGKARRTDPDYIAYQRAYQKEYVKLYGSNPKDKNKEARKEARESP